MASGSATTNIGGGDGEKLKTRKVRERGALAEGHYPARSSRHSMVRVKGTAAQPFQTIREERCKQSKWGGLSAGDNFPTGGSLSAGVLP